MPIYLLSSFLDDFSLLIVDEFVRMNGKKEEQVKAGRDNLREVLDRLNSIYRFDPSIIYCSEFMGTEEYMRAFQEVQEQAPSKGLENLILKTVPLSRQHLDSAREYPLHELACVKYLIGKGFSLKIGPPKEKEYDSIMEKMGLQISFAYLLPAYALGTKTADAVVHYIPASRGPHNGQRIFFGEEERKIRQKLQQSCDEALRYFCKIASVSGHILSLEYKENREIESLSGHQLQKETLRLVFDNIIAPYQEVS